MGNSAVLLVEDNDINRDMLTRRLTRAGLTVITAADGISALEMMREHQPGVVLMDMTLPILEAGKPHRRQKRSCHCRDTDYRADGTCDGGRQRARHERRCSEYETKPIDFPALLAKIYQFLEGSDA